LPRGQHGSWGEPDLSSWTCSRVHWWHARICVLMYSSTIMRVTMGGRSVGLLVAALWQFAANGWETLRWCWSLLPAGTERTVPESQVNMVIICC
jgi:hypothetical protein